MVYDIKETMGAHSIPDKGNELGTTLWGREFGQVDNR